MTPGRLEEAGGGMVLQTMRDEVITKKQPSVAARLSREHDLVLKTYRILIADLCQQFGMGHPG